MDRKYDEVCGYTDEIEKRAVPTKPEWVADLSQLKTVRMRMKGQAHGATVAERRPYSSDDCWLVREPDNELDANVVVVTGG